uniref:Ig-like domain-containing protein n=1 Tax=Amphilophus citrinellus TaxID=61819 RepID=A0A3Q0QW32_AMPCI
MFFSFWSGCSDEQIFETKTVRVGENINLTCTRRDVGTLFWIKLVSGKFPKILGRSFSSQSDDQHIRTGTEPGTFVLYITKAQQSDTGVYICMKTANRDLTFLNGIYLKVEGPDPVFTTAAPSDPVHQHTVTLQCSVLQDFQNKTCPADGRVVFWFREGTQTSHRGIIYTDGNRQHKCEKRSETQQSCVYRFSKNVSSSDEGTYYCAVATCGEIMFGNGTKIQMAGSEFTALVITIICLVISLILNIIFICCRTPRASCEQFKGNFPHIKLIFKNCLYSRPCLKAQPQQYLSFHASAMSIFVFVCHRSK